MVDIRVVDHQGKPVEYYATGEMDCFLIGSFKLISKPEKNILNL